MRRTLIIIVVHVLPRGELGFGYEGVALAAGVFGERPGFEGEDVGLAVLRDETLVEFIL